MYGDGRHVVLDLLRERVGQSGESAHVHPHGQILSFNKTGRNVPPLKQRGK
jgi:hypothetical protein